MQLNVVESALIYSVVTIYLGLRPRINIYEYLKPDFKNLIAGLSESVEKCTKS